MPIPKNFLKENRISARDKAYLQIQQWIIEGDFLPGEKLNDLEIAEALGMSRTPVRGAIESLAMEDLVEIKRGKETVVTEIRREEILQIVPVLAGLEEVTVEFALPRMDLASLRKMERCNEKMRVFLENEEYREAIRYDREFHEIMDQVAENRFLKPPVNALRAQISRMYWADTIRIDFECVEEHERLVKAFQDKSITELKRIVRMHCERPIYTYYKMPRE